MNMTPKLTREQCEALDRSDGPLAVENERTHRVYYVVDEPTLSSLQHEEELAAIRDGVAAMQAGRIVTLEELDARIRGRFGSLAN